MQWHNYLAMPFRITLLGREFYFFRKIFDKLLSQEGPKVRLKKTSNKDIANYNKILGQGEQKRRTGFLRALGSE